MTTLTRDVSSGVVPVVEGVVYALPTEPAPGQSYTVPAGLAVVAEHSENRWVFRDLVTGIYGQGPTPWKAASDFRTALREHKDVLERQSELSAALQSQLEYLRERV